MVRLTCFHGFSSSARGFAVCRVRGRISNLTGLAEYSFRRLRVATAPTLSILQS